MTDYDRYLFGKNLRHLRTINGYNQSQLASKVGVSQNAISQWESGAREPESIEIFLKLASILGVTLDDLVKSNLQNTTISFSSANEAMEFILRQPLVANFGGYDLESMSDEEIIDMADEISEMLKIMARRHKK